MGKKDKKKDKDKDKKGKKDKGSSKALVKTVRGLGKLVYTLAVLGLIGGFILYAYNAGWFDKAREAAQQLIEKVTHKPDDALKAIVKDTIPLADATYTVGDQPKTTKLPLVAVEPKGTFVVGGFLFANQSFQSITLPVKDQPTAVTLTDNAKASGIATLKLEGYDRPTFPGGGSSPKAKDPVFLVTYSEAGEPNIVPAHVKEVGVKTEARTVFTVTVPVGSYAKIPTAVVNKDKQLIGIVVTDVVLKGDEAIFEASPYPVVE